MWELCLNLFFNLGGFKFMIDEKINEKINKQKSISDSFKMAEQKKELSGIKSNLIIVPSSIVFDTTMSKERVGVFSYLYCKTTLDYKVCFSLYTIMDWLDKKVDRHFDKNTSTKNVIDIVNCFKDKGIISFEDKFIFSKKMLEVEFNKDNIINMYQGEMFAKIYVDELITIKSYVDEFNTLINYENPKDKKLDSSVVLLVFAYLRTMIPVRNNLAGALHRPDAYDTNYKNISDELGISERMVSKAISVLVDLGLIYERRRGLCTYCKIENGKETKGYKTKNYIFCNTYKRIKNRGKTYLFAEGESYYLKEADDKEEQLNKYEKVKIKT